VGFQVFLDVVGLKASRFPEALLQEIEAADNFVLLITPRAMDRCEQAGDWMAREIAHALKTGRNIVLVFKRDTNFIFPQAENLPEEIRSILDYHGVDLHHTAIDASMDGGYPNA
jgi:hypothetical protein